MILETIGNLDMERYYNLLEQEGVESVALKVIDEISQKRVFSKSDYSAISRIKHDVLVIFCSEILKKKFEDVELLKRHDNEDPTDDRFDISFSIGNRKGRVRVDFNRSFHSNPNSFEYDMIFDEMENKFVSNIPYIEFPLDKVPLLQELSNAWFRVAGNLSE